jgi:hypothetical protein
VTRPTFSAYVAQQIGTANWVYARRTVSVTRRYGADVVCLSPSRYRALQRDYRQLYGDPNDPQRGALYVAAKDALALWDGDVAEVDAIVVVQRLRAVLQAEAAFPER